MSGYIIYATTAGSPPPQPEIHLDVHSATQELEALVSNDPSRSPLLRRRGFAAVPARRPPTAPPSYPPPPTPPSGPRMNFQFARKPVRPSPLAGPVMLSLNDSAISLCSSSPPSPVGRVSSSPDLTLLSSVQPQGVYAQRSKSSHDLREYSPISSLEMKRKSTSSGRDAFLEVPMQGNDRPRRSSDEISIHSSQFSVVDMQAHLPQAGSIGYRSSPDVPESISRATSLDDDMPEIDGKHAQYGANAAGSRSLESLRSTGGVQDSWPKANTYEITPTRSARAPASAKHYRDNSGKSISRCSLRSSISSRLAHRPSLAFAALRATPRLEAEVKPALFSPTDSWRTSTTSSTYSVPSSERVSTATSRTSSESIVAYPSQKAMDDSTLLVPRGSRDSLRRCTSAVNIDDSRPLSVVAEELDDSCTIQTTAATLANQPSFASRFSPLRNFAGRVRSRTLSIGTRHPAKMVPYGESKSRVSKESIATTRTSTGGISHVPERPSSPGWGLVSLKSVNRKLRRPQTATPLARLPSATQTPVPPLSPLPPNSAKSSQEITPAVNSNAFPRSSVSGWRRPSTSPGGYINSSFLSFGSLGGRQSTDRAREAYSALPFTLSVNTEASRVLRSGVMEQAWPDSPTIIPWGNGTDARRSEAVVYAQEVDEAKVMNMTEGTASVDELGRVRRSDQKSTRSMRSNSTAGTKLKKEGTVRTLWRNLTLGGNRKQL